MSPRAPTQVTIRPSSDGDSAELTRLATIDSAAVPDGPLVVAEVDGQLRAALAIEDGDVIADPFAPSLKIVALLREYGRPRPRARSRRLARFSDRRRNQQEVNR